MEGFGAEASIVVVGHGPATTSVTVAEVLAASSVAGVDARKNRLPSRQQLVYSVAVPLVSVATHKHRRAIVERHWPVAAEGATVAVSVTGWPNVEGFSAVASAAVVGFGTGGTHTCPASTLTLPPP